MASTSQKKEVLKYLQAGNTITSMEAIDLFGATRLSAIIYDIKADGYNISTTMVDGKNRYGNSVSYAEYKLIP